MRAYISFKEIGKRTPGNTVYVGNDITRQTMIDFFGLEENDIEWFDIKIEN